MPRRRRAWRIAAVVTVAGAALPVVVVPVALCLAVAIAAAVHGDAGVFLAPLRGSVLLGMAVAAGGTVIAGAAAIAAVSAPRGLRRLLDVAMVAPLLVPPAATAVAVLRVGGRTGWLQQLLPGIEAYGLGGLVAASTVANVPLAYVVLRIAARAVDGRLVESARVAGASGDVVLLRVVLPRMASAAVLAATTLVVAAIVDPSAAAVLRGRQPTLALAALSDATVSGDPGSAAIAGAMLTVLLGIACVPAVRHGIPLRRLRDAVSASSRGLALGGWAVGVARVVTGVHVVVVAALAATFAVAVASSLRSDAHALLADGAVLAATVGHALVALVVALCLGATTAWLARGSSAAVAAAIDRLHLALAFVPATAIGVGASLAYRAGTDAFAPLVGGAAAAGGSLGIVAMLVVVCQPLVHVGLRIGGSQLPVDVLDAARVVGAGQQRLAALALSSTRLLAVAFAAALTARAIVTVVPVAHVASPTMPLVTTTILDAIDDAALGSALATSATTALATAALMGLVWVVVQLRALPTARGRR